MNMHKLFKGLVILALLPILPTGGPMPMRAAPKSVESTAPAIVESAGVELSPGYSQDAAPGSVVTYTHVLTNTGTTTDTFALDATSSQGWPASLLSVTGTLNLPLQLNAGLTTTFLISLSVPTVAVSGTVDTAIITATSQTSPTISAVAMDTTTVKNVTWYVYLPLVPKRWPPIPDVPVLNPISNPDGDGNYTVSWNAAYLADTYTLQEDDNAAFSSPTTPYTGPGTSWPASGKPAGTYYYRVKATNVYGDSGWSNAQSVSVFPPGTLYSIADADVLQGYPNTNYGSDAAMWAGYDDYLNPDGMIARSHVQFDVSAIPAGATINSAVLRVFLVSSYDFPNRTRLITTYRISSPWVESSVTWNTSPAFAEAYGSAPVTHGAWGWYSFDVTNLVRGWVNGTFPNYGIMLRGPEVSGSDSSWKGFSTREWSNSPQLVITYSGSFTLVDTQTDE
ncbi:MAG TPA: DNRLRE domain-containing protein [Anaerolineae bacterium]|nr:DNRLRE domain-containing protein [Anaerolineae bacterium]